MASPSSSRPSNSTFGGNNHGPGWFQSDGRNPFKQEANQGSLSFAEASPWIFHNHAFLPRNAFQSSGLSDNGSLTSNSTCQAHSTGVSPPLFSFKDASPSFMDTTNKCEPKAPLCHTSPLGGGSLMLEASQSGAANATFGPANCSTFSTARAPSVASANSQKAPGRSSAPFFSFGKSPSIAATSKEDCLRRPSQQPPFTFSSTPRPEPQSLSRNPLAQGANGTSDLSWGQNESLSSRGSLPIRSAPSSPFAPASPREYSFWRPSAPTMRIGDRTQEFLNFSCTAPNPTIPISAEQNVVGPVLTSPVLVSGPSSGSLNCGQNALMPPFSVFGPYKGPLQSAPSFSQSVISTPGFNKDSTSGGFLFSPISYGALQSEEFIDSMEDEKIVSVSAMPSYENMSPEELRWQDYQLKKTAPSFSQSVISTPGFNKGSTSGGFLFSPISYGALQSAEFIDSMEDEKIVSVSAMPSHENISPEELRWQDYQSKKTGSLILMPSSPSSSKSPEITNDNRAPSASNGSNSEVVVLGSPSLPVLAFSESSGKDGVATLSGLIQPNSVSGLDRPEYSLQLTVATIPGPITTFQPSSPLAVVEQNISVQMPLERTTTEMASRFSNIMHSSARVGISSLPDTGNSPQTRSISLVAGKRIFQKAVIRMRTRRLESCKQDGPRVSILKDYMD